jgi:hypothetical protein
MAITPEVMEDLWTIYSTNTNNTAENLRAAIFAGQMPEIYGVRPIVCTSGIDESGDVVCGVYSREAIGMAVMWDLRIKMVEKPSSVGYEITASSAYAVKEINDLCGCGLTADGQD